MKKAASVFLVVLVGMFAVTGFAQDQSTPTKTRQVKSERRPAFSASNAQSTSSAAPDYNYYSMLNGLPMALFLHHDTVAGTGAPIDIYEYVIEMQIMNSDGSFEPIGLQIHNFYTMRPQDGKHDINTHNAQDCKKWTTLIVNALRNRDPNSPTWPYVQFMVAQGARTIDTNEHGSVFYSDDIQCWGSMDRFPPF